MFAGFFRGIHASYTDESQHFADKFWPGQLARLDRLAAAIAEYRSVAGTAAGPNVEISTLLDAPDRLAAIDERLSVLAFQTIVRDYLAPDELARYELGITDWLSARAPTTALFVKLENDHAPRDPEHTASLSVRFHDRGRGIVRLVLGRTHPHPRQIFRDVRAVAAFVEALSAAAG